MKNGYMVGDAVWIYDLPYASEAVVTDIEPLQGVSNVVRCHKLNERVTPDKVYHITRVFRRPDHAAMLADEMRADAHILLKQADEIEQGG